MADRDEPYDAAVGAVAKIVADAIDGQGWRLVKAFEEATLEALKKNAEDPIRFRSYDRDEMEVSFWVDAADGRGSMFEIEGMPVSKVIAAEMCHPDRVAEDARGDIRALQASVDKLKVIFAAEFGEEF